MKTMRPWSKPFAIVAVSLSAAMVLLVVVNLALSPGDVGSWLPLVVMAPWFMGLGIWSLRNQNRR